MSSAAFFSLSATLFVLRITGIELHAEHIASYSTVLWRHERRQTQALVRREVAIGAHMQQFSNVTTELEYARSEYIGTVGVGTLPNGDPQFEARVVFDTGSTNLWVASVLCRTAPCRPERDKFYDPEKSISHELLQEQTNDLKVVFGSGQLQGPMHVDTYRVGEMEVQKQPFAMIRTMTGEGFAQFPFEGILGLGFKSMSFGGIEPFFDRVIAQKLLAHNEFAFYINMDKDKPSAILWGGIDKGLYEGPIRMFPVVQPHYWAVELVDFRFGNMSLMAGEKVEKDSHLVTKLIFDTGTKFFTAPKAVYSKMLSQIPAATSCEDLASYPALTYVLRGSDGKTFDLDVPPTAYLLAGHDACHLAFRAHEVHKEFGPALLVGELFMRNFFVVFSRGNGDLANARVGVASAKIGAETKVQSH